MKISKENNAVKSLNDLLFVLKRHYIELKDDEIREPYRAMMVMILNKISQCDTYRIS